MNNLPQMIEKSTENQTMSSLEIAKLTQKKHFHVLRDIENLIGQAAISPSKIGLSNYKTDRGKTYPIYNLNFEATMTLITGYDALRRSMVITRWVELEKEKQASVNPYASQIPKNYSDALRLAADLVEESKRLGSQLQQAKPKAEFADTYLSDSSQWMKTAEVAKKLMIPGIGNIVLMSALRKAGLLLKDNTPNQKLIDTGYAFTRETKITHNDGSEEYRPTTYWTRRGFLHITRIISRLDFRGWKKMAKRIDAQGHLLTEFLPKVEVES